MKVKEIIFAVSISFNLMAQCLSDIPEIQHIEDNSTRIQAAIDLIGVRGGGTLRGENGKTYLIKNKGLLVNYSNVTLQDMKLRHDPSAPGHLITWATANSTLGGGLRNVHLVGTVDRASGGGVCFGPNGYKASNYTVDNLVVESFAQYGVAIHNGDLWSVSNVRVLNHGGTASSSVPCTGFVVFPTIPSSGGSLNNIYSEISRASEATSASTAAIKLECHSGLNATHLTAIRGTEEAFVVYCVGGRISDVYVEPGTHNRKGSVGVSVGNQPPSGSRFSPFAGQCFTLENVTIKPIGCNDFSLATDTGAPYALAGCTIRNVTGKQASYLGRNGAVKDCVFENFRFETIDFNIDSSRDCMSTNCIFRNVIATGGDFDGVCAIAANGSLISECGVVGNSLNKGKMFKIRGCGNLLKGITSYRSGTDAIIVEGSFNTLAFPCVDKNMGADVVFEEGSDNNRIVGGCSGTSGLGIVNKGRGNRY